MKNMEITRHFYTPEFVRRPIARSNQAKHLLSVFDNELFSCTAEVIASGTSRATGKYRAVQEYAIFRIVETPDLGTFYQNFLRQYNRRHRYSSLGYTVGEIQPFRYQRRQLIDAAIRCEFGNEHGDRRTTRVPGLRLELPESYEFNDLTWQKWLGKRAEMDPITSLFALLTDQD